MAEYMTHNYYFSNKKIRDLGFKFKWADPYISTHETIQWYLTHGWIEREHAMEPKEAE
jgi:hypothetical protein